MLEAPVRARLMLRDALSLLLGIVPLAWLQPLRYGYARARLGSTRSSFLKTLLLFVRYRKPDESVSAFRLPDNPEVQLVNSDSFVARRVYWLGQHGYEGHEVDCWAALCRQAKGIIEIGANIGLYTVLGGKSAPDTPYTAIEPHPRSAAILRRNVELNALAAVSVIEAALVGKKVSDTLALSIPDRDRYESPCGAALTIAAERVDEPANTFIEVRVLEARDVIAGTGHDIDLIKIDVEGNEYEILSHLDDWLGTVQPAMFIEVLPQARQLRGFIRSLCDRYGYAVFFINRSRLQEAPREALLNETFPARHRTRDVILLPPGSWFDLATNP